MILARRVEKRRVPRNALRLCGVQSAAKEKNILLRGRIFASTRQVLRLNDRLASLVPRRKPRARGTHCFLALDRRRWRPASR